MKNGFNEMSMAFQKPSWERQKYELVVSTLPIVLTPLNK